MKKAISVCAYQLRLKDIEAGQPWTAAEQKLIAKARDGLVWISGPRPEAASDTTEIRATLVKHLLLGGCDECVVADAPIAIRGAWIRGKLDLKGCFSTKSLALTHCHLDQCPNLRGAELDSLNLTGSHCPGLYAQRLKTKRSLFLRNGFEAKGSVDLHSADIGGQFSCAKGRFENPGGLSINAQRIKVGASLKMTTGFEARGKVYLNGARIEGQWDCSGGRIEGAGGEAINAQQIKVEESVFMRRGFTAIGTVRLHSAEIKGQFSCAGGRFETPGGVALNTEDIHIGTGLLLRQGFTAKGKINLNAADIGGQLDCRGGIFEGPIIAARLKTGFDFAWNTVETPPNKLDLKEAHVAILSDDLASWQGINDLNLSGFRYDAIQSRMTLKDRLNWLSGKWDEDIAPAAPGRITLEGQSRPFRPPYLRDDFGTEFDPQPYTQLARVLHGQGQRGDAARVLETRDRRLHSAAKRRVLAAVDFSLRRDLAALVALVRAMFYWCFGAVFGYGHRPGKAVFWVLGILALNWFIYAQADKQGAMTPTSPIVLTSADWAKAVPYRDGTPTAQPSPIFAWKNSPAAQDHTTFNAALYAFDVFIPLDALGQEEAWAPSPIRGIWGKIGFWAAPVTQVLGWLITAITAAALTGFVGRKD